MSLLSRPAVLAVLRGAETWCPLGYVVAESRKRVREQYGPLTAEETERVGLSRGGVRAELEAATERGQAVRRDQPWEAWRWAS